MSKRILIFDSSKELPARSPPVTPAQLGIAGLPVFIVGGIAYTQAAELSKRSVTCQVLRATGTPCFGFREFREISRETRLTGIGKSLYAHQGSSNRLEVLDIPTTFRYYIALGSWPPKGFGPNFDLTQGLFPGFPEKVIDRDPGHPQKPIVGGE
ncbi:hypothetical protein C8R44DRAFT_751660 [Mycena epipterygia]|nr:hypothetical protein C8R44DRAFT_751660 [Mycena epipterygia]